MDGTSALLIDLENYIRRMNEAAINRGKPKGKNGHAINIRNEITYLQKIAFDATAGRRLIVQRAYADFRVSTLAGGGNDHPPNILMDMGIEPVQIYAFGMQKKSADASIIKNSADVRIIMDATVLAAAAHPPDQFIIVAGDADYIPLILDLRRRGAEVVVIAPEGGAAKRLQYHCDKYLTFKNGRLAKGMDQEGMRTDFMTYLSMLKEEVPDMHLMGKGKWEVFRTRAFQCSASRPPFLLSDLESLIRDFRQKGEVELTSEDIRGGVTQMQQSGCFQLDPATAGPNQKVKGETDKFILDPTIGDWKALHRRVCDWLIEWFVEKEHDPRLVELALESGGDLVLG